MKIELLNYLLETAKDAYVRQVEDTHKIRERIESVSNFMITPTTALLIYLFSNYKGNFWAGADLYLFTIPASISATLVIFSIGMVLYILTIGGTYSHPPLPEKINDFAFNLDVFNQSNSISVDETELEVKKSLLNSYSIAVSHNSNVINITRSNRIMLTVRVMVFSVIFLGISSPSYIYRSVNAEKESTSVKILTPVKIDLGDRHEQYPVENTNRCDTAKCNPNSERAAANSSTTNTANNSPASSVSAKHVDR